MQHVLRIAVLAALVLAACSPPSRCEGDSCDDDPGCTTDTDCGTARCVSGACVAKSDRVLDVCVAAAGAEQCATNGAIELDFGSLAVGNVATLAVHLRSKGTAAVTVSKLELTGSPAFGTELPSTPAAVAAGGELVVPVVFTPSASGAVDGHLAIDSDDPTAVHVSVHVVGKGVDGCQLGATLTTIDFGDVAVSSRSEAMFSLVNPGTSACTVAGMQVVSGAEFSLATPATTLVIAPGSSQVIHVAVTPIAIGAIDGLLRFTSNGGPLEVHLHANAVIPPKCSLVATPGNASGSSFLLGFGTVDVSSDTLLTIDLRNVGGAACSLGNARIVTAIGVDGSAYGIRHAPPASLAPGASASLAIGFHPASAGIYGAPPPSPRTIALFLDTGDAQAFAQGLCAMPGTPTGNAGCAAWTLSGTAAAPAFTVSPTTLDAGPVTVGCRSAEHVITLSNTGTNTVTVTQLAMMPFLASFTTGGIPNPPFTIPPGQKVELKGRYAPGTEVVEQATLFIGTDVPNGQGGTRSYQVALKGTGVAAGTVRESFVQAASAKVDVLWVIDNSGSMGEEQLAISQNASRFVGRANAAAADYHIGIVSTDMDDPTQKGRLLAPPNKPKFIVPGANAANDFALYVGLGTDGSGTEMGMGAMYAALTNPLISSGTANAGFVRADARLAVIVVSDEEDQSTGTTSMYTNFLDGLKGAGRSDETSLSAIVGDPTTPSNPSGGCPSAVDAGDRYVTVQQATGGKFRSICASDWGQIADDLANDIFSLPRYVNLTGLVEAGTVDVKVNGAALPSGAWSYDVSSNRVIFASANVPAAGSAITVEYRPMCQ